MIYCQKVQFFLQNCATFSKLKVMATCLALLLKMLAFLRDGAFSKNLGFFPALDSTIQSLGPEPLDLEHEQACCWVMMGMPFV